MIFFKLCTTYSVWIQGTHNRSGHARFKFRKLCKSIRLFLQWMSSFSRIFECIYSETFAQSLLEKFYSRTEMSLRWGKRNQLDFQKCFQVNLQSVNTIKDLKIPLNFLPSMFLENRRFIVHFIVEGKSPGHKKLTPLYRFKFAGEVVNWNFLMSQKLNKNWCFDQRLSNNSWLMVGKLFLV